MHLKVALSHPWAVFTTDTLVEVQIFHWSLGMETTCAVFRWATASIASIAAARTHTLSFFKSAWWAVRSAQMLLCEKLCERENFPRGWARVALVCSLWTSCTHRIAFEAHSICLEIAIAAWINALASTADESIFTHCAVVTTQATCLTVISPAWCQTLSAFYINLKDR